MSPPGAKPPRCLPDRSSGPGQHAPHGAHRGWRPCGERRGGFRMTFGGGCLRAAGKLESLHDQPRPLRETVCCRRRGSENPPGPPGPWSFLPPGPGSCGLGRTSGVRTLLLPEGAADMPGQEAVGPPVIVTFPARLDAATADHVAGQITAALTPGASVVIADLDAAACCA